MLNLLPSRLTTYTQSQTFTRYLLLISMDLWGFITAPSKITNVIIMGKLVLV